MRIQEFFSLLFVFYALSRYILWKILAFYEQKIICSKCLKNVKKKKPQNRTKVFCFLKVFQKSSAAKKLKWTKFQRWASPFYERRDPWVHSSLGLQHVRCNQIIGRDKKKRAQLLNQLLTDKGRYGGLEFQEVSPSPSELLLTNQWFPMGLSLSAWRQYAKDWRQFRWAKRNSQDVQRALTEWKASVSWRHGQNRGAEKQSLTKYMSAAAHRQGKGRKSPQCTDFIVRKAAAWQNGTEKGCSLTQRPSFKARQWVAKVWGRVSGWSEIFWDPECPGQSWRAKWNIPQLEMLMDGSKSRKSSSVAWKSVRWTKTHIMAIRSCDVQILCFAQGKVLIVLSKSKRPG